jgi:hypothetical protein
VAILAEDSPLTVAGAAADSSGLPLPPHSHFLPRGNRHLDFTNVRPALSTNVLECEVRAKTGPDVKLRSDAPWPPEALQTMAMLGKAFGKHRRDLRSSIRSMSFSKALGTVCLAFGGEGKRDVVARRHGKPVHSAPICIFDRCWDTNAGVGSHAEKVCRPPHCSLAAAPKIDGPVPR